MIARRLLALGGVCLAFLYGAQPAVAQQAMAQASGTITRISVGSSGPGGGSYAVVSGDGRFVAFESPAAGMLPGQISDSWDTYLSDRTNGKLERVSVRTGGAATYNPADYTSPPDVSSDGRYVAFNSRAEDIVTNDANHAPDIFLRDRQANTTELISIGTDGKSGNGDSYTPVISTNGRYVAFQSFASNLVLGDSNQSLDVFVRDRQTGTTELVSVTDSGAQGQDWHDYGYPGLAISGDGRFVAFAYQDLPVGSSPGSSQSNIYLRDRQARTTRLIAPGSLPALSADGRWLAFVTSEGLLASDKNLGPDIYLYDRSNGALQRVSTPVGVSEAKGASIIDAPSLSADGRYIAFASTAKLLPEDTNAFADIYLRDQQNGALLLVTAAPNGQSASAESHNPDISADGQVVAFTSLADNLVTGDTNNANDTFAFVRQPATLITLPYQVFVPVILAH